MFVTRHTNIVDAAVLDRLWALYEAAYLPTTTETVTREMLYRSEFDSSMADPTNRVWVLWDDDQPVGIALVATDASATHYLSREYFERNFGDHVRRNAVHYLVWIVVHPTHGAKGTMLRLTREAIFLEADEGALLVFDAPQMHLGGQRGGSPGMMSRLASTLVGGAPVHELETHRYFAADFSETARARAAREPVRSEADAKDLSRA